jgi:hypothetical protein
MLGGTRGSCLKRCDPFRALPRDPAQAFRWPPLAPARGLLSPLRPPVVLLAPMLRRIVAATLGEFVTRARS